MVSLSQGNVSDFRCVWDSINRPVCIEAQPQVGNVLQLGQGSGSLCYRFPQHQVGQHVGLRIPTNLPCSASATEDMAVGSEDLVGSSLMTLRPWCPGLLDLLVDIPAFCPPKQKRLHCTKTYIPTTWESIGYADGNALNPAK